MRSGTFEEDLEALIEEHREEGDWIDEIITALELALMGLKSERDS